MYICLFIGSHIVRNVLFYLEKFARKLHIFTFLYTEGFFSFTSLLKLQENFII